MQRRSESGDWTFCFEMIGPLATDTGGLTYQRHFFENLDEEHRRRMVALLSRPVPAELDLRGVELRTLPTFTTSGPGKALAVQALAPLLFKRMGVSVALCAGSIAGVLNRIGGGPRIIVHVQNAAPLQRSVTVAGTWRDIYRRAAVPAGLRGTRRVITPSEIVRTRLLEQYDLQPDRVVVIPLGVDQRRFSPTATDDSTAPPDIPSPYILFVSTLWPYKNARALVAAFARLVRREGIPHHLALVGKDGGDRADLEALAAAEGVLDRLVFTGHLTRDELPPVYRHADLFVYPSLVESFGFPLVEAMASGIPVVASDRWAIPETCDDAARICDATDVDDLTGAMREVLFSDELRADLVRRGLARASRFSWDRTVAETLRVVEEVALEDD